MVESKGSSMGVITSVKSAVVDVFFEGEMPNILNALECSNNGKKLILGSCTTCR